MLGYVVHVHFFDARKLKLKGSTWPDNEVFTAGSIVCMFLPPCIVV